MEEVPRDSDDVDFADAILTSPEMDLSNGGGDQLLVWIIGGVIFQVKLLLMTH